MGSFLRFFYNFLENFYNFWKISTIFWKISTIFLENFHNFLRFFGKFFRKFLPTIRYGSTGVSPYCKFTSKFTPKFTPILIKILQSTKFEGSHFFNSLATFITFYRYYWVSITFHNLLSLPKTLPFATAFSRPWLRRFKVANGRPSPYDGGGMWAIRGIISRITSLIVSRLTSQRPGRKPTKNRGKTKAPSPSPFLQASFPFGKKSQILIS